MVNSMESQLREIAMVIEAAMDRQAVALEGIAEDIEGASLAPGVVTQAKRHVNYTVQGRSGEEGGVK